MPAERDETDRPITLTRAGISARLRQVRGFRAEDRLARQIGIEIRQRRRGRGLSQGALAALVGRDRSTICRWEAGERLPTVPAILALGDALRCEASALLPRVFTEED